MLIGIDGNEANIRERVGVNVWAFELLKQFKRTKEDTKFVIYLSRPPLSDLPQETEHWTYRVIPPAKFWTRWRLPLDLYLHNPRPDVFLSLSHYAPKWAPMPRVVCIMDLSFLKFPEAFTSSVRWQLVNWTRESVKKAARVITISEFNKKEIVREYGYPEEKIKVVYPGVSEIFKGLSLRTQGESLREKYGIEGKYLFFVGTRQPKKNLPRLLEAFQLVRKEFPEVRLVIAGKVWHQFAEEKAKGRRPKDKGITYLGFVPDGDLPGLVAGAQALIIPSLYEGFGIPAAEAMSIGTLTAVSNVTSFPEVVGDAGVLFDPYSIESIAGAIRRVFTMPIPEKNDLIKKGMIRAAQFRWDRAAETVVEVLIKTTHDDAI